MWTWGALQVEVRLLAFLGQGCAVSVDRQGSIAQWGAITSAEDLQQPAKQFRLPHHLVLPCPQ